MAEPTKTKAKKPKKIAKKRFAEIARPIRYELRLSDEEGRMLQELMAADGVSAADLIRRWIRERSSAWRTSVSEAAIK